MVGSAHCVPGAIGGEDKEADGWDTCGIGIYAYCAVTLQWSVNTNASSLVSDDDDE